MSLDLWDVVSNGFPQQTSISTAARIQARKDATALFYIQRAIDEEIFLKLYGATTWKDAWNMIRLEYSADTRVTNCREIYRPCIVILRHC